MKLIACTIAAAALATSFTAQAAEPSSMARQGLSWDRKPLATHMRKFFPDAAKRAGVKDATVELACTPDVWGALDCSVTGETPAGLGFGEAAVQTVEKAKVAGAGHASPEGKTFTYKVHFGKGVAGAGSSLAQAAAR